MQADAFEIDRGQAHAPFRTPFTQPERKLVGATRAEIAEALRVAQYICGVGCVYTAARALKEVLS
jgi:hypothetical protein